MRLVEHYKRASKNALLFL